MSTNSVRYLVEHVALRDALFTAGPRVILDFMGKPGAAMMDLYEKLGKNSPGYECPYTENCFSEDHDVFEKGVDSVLVIRVYMPAPEAVTECRAVYFCFSKLGGNIFYATSEFTDNNTFCLCGWGEDNIHINFGNAPVKPRDEMKKVAELFWEINSDEYGKKLKSVCSG